MALSDEYTCIAMLACCHRNHEITILVTLKVSSVIYQRETHFKASLIIPLLYTKVRLTHTHTNTEIYIYHDITQRRNVTIQHHDTFYCSSKTKKCAICFFRHLLFHGRRVDRQAGRQEKEREKKERRKEERERERKRKR
jgi:hypothetical protein